MEPVRWGILSTARINAAVLPGLRESPLAELVAVASRSRATADAYAREHAIPHAHGTYDALLADPDVEAVYISTPNSLHVEWTVRALEAGKHVLVEKPLHRDPDEVARAFDAADRADRLLMEAFMYRHHPQTVQLAELVAGGAIGELRLVRSTFSHPIGEPDVRLRLELGGGALMDLGCYCVSGSRLLAGEPEAAGAHQILGPSGVDVRLVGTLVFPRGVLAQLDCAFDLPERLGLEAVGSEGILRVAAPWFCTPGLELDRGGAVEHIHVDAGERYRLQTENLCRAIRGEAPPLLGRADALGQARAIDALYRSAELSGEPVAV